MTLVHHIRKIFWSLVREAKSWNDILGVMIFVFSVIGLDGFHHSKISLQILHLNTGGCTVWLSQKWKLYMELLENSIPTVFIYLILEPLSQLVNTCSTPTCWLWISMCLIKWLSRSSVFKLGSKDIWQFNTKLP